MANTLRLILGDQLNYQHSWFATPQPNTTYILMEMRQETDYVRHHAQKVLGFFAAMRQLAQHLQEQGHQVLYLALDDPHNTQRLTQNLQQAILAHNIERFEYQEPDEYRLDQQLQAFCQEISIETHCASTEHFLTARQDLNDFFKGKKMYLLESYYRHMRKRYNILMANAKDPLTGQWNYDKDNRHSPDAQMDIPAPKAFEHDLSNIQQSIEQAGVQTLGNPAAEAYPWPINRQESLEVLAYFVQTLLPQFGRYQDAMHTQETFLYHSRLSFALNTKMLSPLEVVKRVEAAYHENPEQATIAQVEGFIRQILGWREYMRGIYWAKMPEYATLNALDHQRKLPNWYWTGQTKMNCLKHAIGQSLDHAYAHHIQRLMVTGNFALLAGIDPAQVDEWYLGIYIDAIEWVEITNTRGMSQFADDGIVGTKPYVSSANYINKMSNYCKGCYYSHSKKTGPKACPFNSLYWHFYERHREKFEKNPRIGMMYRTLARMKNKEEILQQAEQYLDQIEDL